MVPIRIDFFTILIFLGAIQGLFLSAFFLFSRKEGGIANHLLGLLLFSTAAFCVDIFLGYSGYMTRVLHLVDFTEPLNFVLGPLIYLYAVVTLRDQRKLTRQQYLHFLPFLFYLVYAFLFFLQTADYKYNAYIDAYYPDMPRIDAPARWHQDPLGLKKHVSLLQLVHTSLYFVMAVRIGLAWIKNNGPDAFRKNEPALWVRNLLIWFGTGTAATFLIKLVFERDLGEFLIASVLMVMIYAFSFYVIRRSLFFKKARGVKPEKYSKSALPADRVERALVRVKSVMEEDRLYLSPACSLPMLAEQAGMSTHQVSQLLNAHLGQNFYEFVAAYRIEAAQGILRDATQLHKSIEQIAEEVGYYSKSSFNTAFKKITGQTPSQFRKSSF
ncbi:MAG: helix-turn-helix domain-containing protein [Bacteroidota bacterium]